MLAVPRITLREMRELEKMLNLPFVVRSCLLLGIVEAGSVDLNIAEIGKQSIAENEWFLLSDKGVPSDVVVPPETQGLLLIVPLNVISRSQKCHLSSHHKLDCLNCCDRSASFFTVGKSMGRIRELAKAIGSADSGTLSENFLNLSRCFELIARVLDQPEMDRTAPCRRFITGDDVTSIKEAAKYLDHNLSEDHRLNDICRYCYLNEFKLKKGFRECFGTTVFGYLRLKRMERAKTMIDQGAESVMEIANAVGYTNASHFARAFRQIYGANPGTLISERSKIDLAATGTSRP